MLLRNPMKDKMIEIVYLLDHNLEIFILIAKIR
jgi:hypothetical protein